MRIANLDAFLKLAWNLDQNDMVIPMVRPGGGIGDMLVVL